MSPIDRVRDATPEEIKRLTTGQPRVLQSQSPASAGEDYEKWGTRIRRALHRKPVVKVLVSNESPRGAHNIRLRLRNEVGQEVDGFPIQTRILPDKKNERRHRIFFSRIPILRR